MKRDNTILNYASIFSIFILVVFLISFKPSYATTTTTNTSNQEVVRDDKLNVVTSVAPITNIIQNIGGDKINLVGLVPEGVNSHTFELKPSDTIKINDANLIIIDGLNLEANIEKIAENVISKNPSIRLLKLGDNTITKDERIFDFSFPK